MKHNYTMICQFASSGCNYPDSECSGACHSGPAEIRKARIDAGLTQKQAAIVCRVDLRTWCRWESGQSTMPAGLWELFTLKTVDRWRELEKSPV